jgi:dTDP-4-dehydrorhamnose reductase
MIVVTGASGLLGASILSHAPDFGLEVTGLCHRHPLRVPWAPIFCVDLTDDRAVRAMIASLQPKSIIHCAAVTNVDWCEDHPSETEQVNVQAASVLAETAAQLNARFVYISTDAVFDGEWGNYSESDSAAPINVYAKSKLCGEQSVLRHYPLALVIRTNIYGWNAQNKQSLAEWVLQRLAERKQVPGFTDVYFAPMLVNDLAEILLVMLDRGLTGLYHIAGSERISKYEFARRVATRFGFEPGQVMPIRLPEANLRAPRPLDVSLSTEKIRLALERPMPDVDSGLRRFWALRESGYPQQLKSYLTGAAD